MGTADQAPVPTVADTGIRACIWQSAILGARLPKSAGIHRKGQSQSGFANARKPSMNFSESRFSARPIKKKKTN